MKITDITEALVSEISKASLGRYVKANAEDQLQRASSASFQSGQAGDKYNKADVSDKDKKRQQGMDRAVSKLTKETIDADQKRAGQVASEEKAKNISKVINQAPKKHPFDGRLVGG